MKNFSVIFWRRLNVEVILAMTVMSALVDRISSQQDSFDQSNVKPGFKDPADNKHKVIVAVFSVLGVVLLSLVLVLLVIFRQRIINFCRKRRQFQATEGEELQEVLTESGLREKEAGGTNIPLLKHSSEGGGNRVHASEHTTTVLEEVDHSEERNMDSRI